MDINFPSAPCHILSLDVQDLMGTHIMNVGGNLMKMRYSSLGAELGIWEPQDKSIEEIMMAAKEAFKQKEGCALQGYISVNRVPGNFHISTHDYSQVLALIQEQANLTHSIIELSFGVKSYVKKIRKKFKGDKYASLSPLNGMGTYHT